ncbi:MAG: hypothetical protein ACRC9V_07450, partial [Aeromonas sp.]
MVSTISSPPRKWVPETSVEDQRQFRLPEDHLLCGFIVLKVHVPLADTAEEASLMGPHRVRLWLVRSVTEVVRKKPDAGSSSGLNKEQDLNNDKKKTHDGEIRTELPNITGNKMTSHDGTKAR